MTDRTQNFTLRLSDAERLELDLVAAHMRLDRSSAIRLLVRREAERIRAERQNEVWRQAP